MTKREAAIVSAYTGFLCGNFSDMHEYIEEIMQRPVWTHEMGGDGFQEKIRGLSHDDFVKLSESIME